MDGGCKKYAYLQLRFPALVSFLVQKAKVILQRKYQLLKLGKSSVSFVICEPDYPLTYAGLQQGKLSLPAIEGRFEQMFKANDASTGNGAQITTLSSSSLISSGGSLYMQGKVLAAKQCLEDALRSGKH